MAISISSLDLYNALKIKLGEKEAQMLVNYVENIVHDDVTTQTKNLPKIENIERVREEASTFSSELKADLHKLEEKMERRFESVAVEFKEVKSDIAHRFEKVNADIADVKLEISLTQVKTIRWMFAFWIGQVAVLGGLIFALAK